MASSGQEEIRMRYLIESHLTEGVSLAKGGDTQKAAEVFRRVIQTCPDCEEAWLWLAYCAETPTEAVRLLTEGQTMLRDSPRIAEALRWAEEQRIAQGGQTREELEVEAAQMRRKERREALSGGAKRAWLVTQGSATTLGRWLAKAGAGLAAFWHRLWHVWLTRERLDKIATPVISFITVVIVVAGVMLGFSAYRQSYAFALAEVLPTQDPNLTPTPTTDELTADLWIRANVGITVADWDSAITFLEAIREIAPYDNEACTALANAYYEKALELIDENQLSDANLLLDEAVRLDGNHLGVQDVRRVHELYMEGVEAYWVSDWETVIEKLTRVEKLHSDYKDTITMLCDSYADIVADWSDDPNVDAEDWEVAIDAVLELAEVRPDDPDVQAAIVAVRDAYCPSTRIVVSLADFWVKVYEDDVVVKEWSVMIGRASAPTNAGRYPLQSKMEEAYGSTWNIWMPKWLGLYWAGGTENGFHALPRLSNGAVDWAQYVGQAHSYGCIVSADENAEWLWNWADLGTVAFVNDEGFEAPLMYRFEGIE